jgi:hypothetical protein
MRRAIRSRVRGNGTAEKRDGGPPRERIV